ncbi:glycosyltransferase [Halalkalibaculum sp. DA384]|uniref:glycosyltransferase n=1 Tax=Halalkalibaculum sp. DA384 TaxID=3373606 RepID=UPI00375507A6
MKKKISIVLPNLCSGGVERMRIHLADYFIRKSYEAQFVLFQEKGELLSLVPDEAEVINLNAKKLRDGLIPLRNYITSEKPDALLAAMWPVSIIAIWAAKYLKHKPRVVISEHNQITSTPMYRKGKKGLNKWLIPFSMRLSYPHGDSVIGVSKGVVSDLRNLSNQPLEHATVIYNPAAPATEKVDAIEANNEFWRSQTSKRIIGIGSLKKQKDFPSLIQSFGKVQKEIGAELLILGEGDERPRLERMIQERNLEDSVHLPGFVEEPLQYLKSADLFVLSSAWEGFGNVIVEALACGVPVVSTNCKSGPAEILEDGKYGRLVPVGNPDAIAHAILEELEKEHDPEFLKKRAQDFSVEKIADQYLELLFPGDNS